jgi:hypothetical protein
VHLTWKIKIALKSYKIDFPFFIQENSSNEILRVAAGKIASSKDQSTGKGTGSSWRVF